MQSSWLCHSSPPPPLFLLAPGIAPDSLPCLPCPPAVTFSITSYICPNTVRDEGWRLQSLCPWRCCKKDKPAMWKDLDIYLPKGKKLNRWSFKVMTMLKNLPKAVLLPQDRVQIPKLLLICPANPLNPVPLAGFKLPVRLQNYWVPITHHFLVPPCLPTGAPLGPDSLSLPTCLPKLGESLGPPTHGYSLHVLQPSLGKQMACPALGTCSPVPTASAYVASCGPSAWSSGFLW